MPLENWFIFSALLCICYSSAGFCRAIYDTNVHIEQTCKGSSRVHEYFVGVAYREGVILASECSAAGLGRKRNFY